MCRLCSAQFLSTAEYCINAENSGSNHNYLADRVKKKSDFKLTVTVLRNSKTVFVVASVMHQSMKRV